MFHCALTGIETIEISIATNGSSHVAQLPVGYEDQNGRRYSLMVALEFVPGYGSDVKELIFCVIEYDPESDGFSQIWDGLETKSIFGEPSHRRAILNALGQLVEALIDDVGPRVVTIHTREANLPSRALTKYSLIATTLGRLGYRAGRTDVWHGRHTWIMERI